MESQSSKSKSFIIFFLSFFSIWLKEATSSETPINNALLMLWCLNYPPFLYLHLSPSYCTLIPLCLFLFSPPSASFLAPSQIGSGIGRMILKEEMKARSGSYDNDPWGSARNSRSGSKETLNTTGYGTTAYNNTVNGCKDPPCPLCIALFVSCSFCFCKFMNACTSDCIPVQVCLCPSQCDHSMLPQGLFMSLNICCHWGSG